MKSKMLLVGSLSFLLAGCGGAGSDTPTGNSEGLIVGAVRSEIGNFLTAVQTQPGAALPSDVTSLPAVAGNKKSGAFDDCASYTIGNSSADAHYKLVFNCKAISDGTSVVDWIGFFESNVVDKSDYSQGYVLNHDIAHNILGSGENTRVYKGTNSLVRTPNTITVKSDTEYKTVMENHTPSVDWKFIRKFEGIYKPGDMDDISANGSVAYNGFFKIEGDLGGDGNGNDLAGVKIGFEIISDGLMYDTTCAKYYSEGTLTFIDGAKNKITAEYHCSTVEVTFNGEAIEGWEL